MTSGSSAECRASYETFDSSTNDDAHDTAKVGSRLAKFKSLLKSQATRRYEQVVRGDTRIPVYSVNENGEVKRVVQYDAYHTQAHGTAFSATGRF
jgi:hypothetical protein